MAVLSEEYLNKLTPNHLGVKKKIRAGFINISKDTMKHLVIEDFMLDYPLFVSFTVDDVKAKLDSLYPGRDFFRDSLRTALWVLANEAFPHRIGNQKMNGRKGRVAKYFLTSRIKKISYPKNVIDQMNGFDLLLELFRTPIISSANKSIQVKNCMKELSE